MNKDLKESRAFFFLAEEERYEKISSLSIPTRASRFGSLVHRFPFWDLLPFFCRLVLSRYRGQICLTPGPRMRQYLRVPGIVVWLLYIYRYICVCMCVCIYIYIKVKKRWRTICITRVSVAHGAAVPRGFLTAHPSVFVSSPRDLNRGEKTEEAKRRGERKNKIKF